MTICPNCGSGNVAHDYEPSHAPDDEAQVVHCRSCHTTFHVYGPYPECERCSGLKGELL